MASFAFNTDVTTPQNLADDETGFVGQNGSLFVSGAAAITGVGNNSINVLGSVYASNNHSAIDHSGGTLYLTVGKGGFVGSTDTSAIISQPQNNAFIINNGEISANSLAIGLGASDPNVTFVVKNNGDISALLIGIAMNADTGVRTSALLRNTGSISGELYGVFSNGRVDSSINNYGTILSAGSAFRLGDGEDYVLNHGTVESGAASALGGRNDFYDGRLGTIFGTRQAMGRVEGQSGNDRIFGGTGSEEFVGGTGADDLRGFGGNDRLFGDFGVDALRGGDGDDFLSGGAGSDFLAGGAGADTFRFTAALSAASNVDRLGDFSVFADTIQLAKAVFAGLGASVTAGEFRAGTTAGNSVAADGNDHLIYNKTTGELFYDADGVGGAAKVKFAILSGSPDGLGFSDFVMV